MSDNKQIAAPSFFAELFQFGLYKPSQGKIVRQFTFFAIWIVAIIAGWKLRHFSFSETPPSEQVGWYLFFGMTAIGGWLAYRIVNTQRWADFLIAVEGEFTKISWPTQHELFKSSIVVIFVMAFLAILMWFLDTAWAIIFQLLGIVG
jgi:preprotein translocase subunit SecE